MRQQCRTFFGGQHDLEPLKTKFEPICDQPICSIFLKVHTEVHCGVQIGVAKFPDNIFIHYQDMEILNFSFFLTVQRYFPYQVTVFTG